MGYREQFFEDCRASFGELSERSVLVAGCGPGQDCRPFVEAGARVSGLDISPKIGSSYEDSRVQYYRGSIEGCSLPSEQFDLVFCIATMEHVQGIESAFLEMIRLVRLGGMVYSVAAPLWNSRRGHHFDCLSSFPWIHLRYRPEEIVQIAEQHEIMHNGIAVRERMELLFVSEYFNRAPARRYVEACRNLPVSEMLRNDLWFDGAEELTQEIEADLAAKGYTREELLVTSQGLICRR